MLCTDYEVIITLNILSVNDFAKYFEYIIDMKVFAERLLELRKERKISQAKLATEIGVSFSVVCYWETDRAEPTAPNLVKLSDFFNVSVDYLLGKKDY